MKWVGGAGSSSAGSDSPAVDTRRGDHEPRRLPRRKRPVSERYLVSGRVLFTRTLTFQASAPSRAAGRAAENPGRRAGSLLGRPAPDPAAGAAGKETAVVSRSERGVPRCGTCANPRYVTWEMLSLEALSNSLLERRLLRARGQITHDWTQLVPTLSRYLAPGRNYCSSTEIHHPGGGQGRECARTWPAAARRSPDAVSCAT